MSVLYESHSEYSPYSVKGVSTLWSQCGHSVFIIVDYVLTVWTHCGDYVFFPAGNERSELRDIQKYEPSE